MTSPNLNIKKEGSKMGFADLIKKRIEKKCKFMGGDVTITKLTVDEVEQIQEFAKKAGDNAEGLDLVFFIVKLGCPEAAEVPSEDLKNVPMGELNDLAGAIMSYSGIDSSKGK